MDFMANLQFNLIVRKQVNNFLASIKQQQLYFVINYLSVHSYNGNNKLYH